MQMLESIWPQMTALSARDEAMADADEGGEAAGVLAASGSVGEAAGTSSGSGHKKLSTTV